MSAGRSRQAKQRNEPARVACHNRRAFPSPAARLRSRPSLAALLASATVNYAVIGKTLRVFLRDSQCSGGTVFTFARQPH